ncbi:MAG: S8 family serine peptidase [Gammaproteobacteria bacterium]|nr:S8 family serine peptidase [Gammaproteobacteria bacterium]
MKAYAIRRTLAVIVAWSLAAHGLASTLDQVEDAVQTAVEDQAVEQITSSAAAQVEEQAAEQAEDAALTQVESAVTSRVADAAADQAAEAVASGVTERVSEQAAESVVSQASAAAEARVQHVIGADAVGRVAEQAAGRVEDRVQGAVVAAAGIQLPPQAADAAAAAVDKAASAIETRADKAAGNADAPLDPFMEALDPQGRPIERGVLVLLVPRADLAAVRELGMKVRRESPVPGLDRVLVRLEVASGLTLGQAAALVRQASAAATVDYNHLYELNSAPPSGGSTPAKERAAGRQGPAIGIIDTAVASDHPALSGARIVQRDFIGTQRSMPLGHGTAIASILVQESGRLAGMAPELYAANVFFERAPGVDSATTESIVAALGWLIEQDVAVVNMSLTGPPNELLQVAVESAVGAGAQVVAAVGNNGPVGDPLYPAAYDNVIGVTAVDGSEQVFVYANRGRQVMFAAPGVGVQVADSGGGYAQQDGTSLAAAHAAVIIATSMARLADAGQGPQNVVDRLQRDARDLGPSGIDETYGYGLIAPLDI